MPVFFYVLIFKKGSTFSLKHFFPYDIDLVPLFKLSIFCPITLLADVYLKQVKQLSQ